MPRMLVAEHGDEAPIEWVHRERRFGEKLATPDTSIADLIGEVDPIKVAEGRYLSDELTIHYGLVPRTNRGIFAINELPDPRGADPGRSAQRARGARCPDPRLQDPAPARPHARRLGQPGGLHEPGSDHHAAQGPVRQAQIRTHYPLDVDVEIDVIEQESEPVFSPGLSVHVPEFMTEIVAEMSQQARRSPHVNQRSGVSVRLSIANHETLIANATRRALRNGETEVVPRVSDLDALVASTAGKVEFETVDDGREDQILDRMIKAAVLDDVRARTKPERLVELVKAFDEGLIVHTGADVPRADTANLLPQLPRLADTLTDLDVGETPAGVACPRSSSCSRGYTSRSASTRTRLAASRRIAGAAESRSSGRA